MYRYYPIDSCCGVPYENNSCHVDSSFSTYYIKIGVANTSKSTVVLTYLTPVPTVEELSQYQQVFLCLI